jgi:predicted ester cyclase
MDNVKALMYYPARLARLQNRCYIAFNIRFTTNPKEYLMSIEQVARDFVANTTNMDMIKAMITPDAMASGGVLPQPIPVMDSMQVMSGLTSAFPDFNLQIQQVSVNGNQATVRVTWSGTQKGPLDLSMPGMAPIPATGKKVSVKDAYIVTVQGNKVSHLEVISPADGGIPAALMQLGVKGPSM